MTNRPLDALSATVSVIVMSQPAMRLSTISIAACARGDRGPDRSCAARSTVEVGAEDERDLGLDLRLQ